MATVEEDLSCQELVELVTATWRCRCPPRERRASRRTSRSAPAAPHLLWRSADHPPGRHALRRPSPDDGKAKLLDAFRTWKHQHTGE